MNLLNALEKQMQENDTTETSTGNG